MSHVPCVSKRQLVLVSAAFTATASMAAACQVHLDPAAAVPALNPNVSLQSPIFTPDIPAANIAARNPESVLVPMNLNRVGQLRPKMAGEGLLEHRINPFSPGGNIRFGSEFTGWIDARHPALAGPRDNILGYDRYERQIDQATTILTDNAGVVANANVTRDLNHANRVIASQAGVSVIERSTRGYTSPAVGQAGSFNFPLDFATEETPLMAQNVAGGRVNVYYGRDLSSGAYGETAFPSFTAGGNNEAIFMAERVRRSDGTFIPITRNTHAHELTHFVTDGKPLHVLAAAPDAFHSDDRRNIIGQPQYDPGQAMGTNIGTVAVPELVPWDIPDTDIVAGPSASTSAGGAPRVGGISQLKRSQLFTPAAGATPARGVFGDANVAPYLTKNDNITAADKVDLNFAVDDWITEDLGGGADTYTAGRESLYFAPITNPINVPADPAATADNGGKDKGGFGAFDNPAFYQGTFRFIDVFSINAHFADYDVDDSGASSFRAANLDYDVTFVLPGNILVAGTPTDVFTEGWSNLTFVDDYIARWMSPADAIGVLITAHQYLDLQTGQFIGNAQIDAVIVSNVPEPGSLALIAAAGLVMRRRR